VITAAAAIMVCVFASFVLGDSLTIKLFGVGLASAVFLDAFLIRTVLVPALMALMARVRGGCRAASPSASRTSTSTRDRRLSRAAGQRRA